MQYRAALSDSDAHLTRRLEGFGDVVFGFSVSQLALQLKLPHSPSDVVGDPIRYVLYFGTFFLIVMFWLRFHSVLTGAFEPRPVDIALVMIYLSFIGLVPYALSAIALNGGSRVGLGAYLIIFSALTLTGLALQTRNFRRGYWTFDEKQRFKSWRRMIVTLAIGMTMLGCLALDIIYGGQIAGPACILISLVPLLARKLTKTPSAAWLRIPEPAASA